MAPQNKRTPHIWLDPPDKPGPPPYLVRCTSVPRRRHLSSHLSRGRRPPGAASGRPDTVPVPAASVALATAGGPSTPPAGVTQAAVGNPTPDKWSRCPKTSPTPLIAAPDPALPTLPYQNQPQPQPLPTQTPHHAKTPPEPGPPATGTHTEDTEGRPKGCLPGCQGIGPPAVTTCSTAAGLPLAPHHSPLPSPPLTGEHLHDPVCCPGLLHLESSECHPGRRDGAIFREGPGCSPSLTSQALPLAERDEAALLAPLTTCPCSPPAAVPSLDLRPSTGTVGTGTLASPGNKPVPKECTLPH